MGITAQTTYAPKTGGWQIAALIAGLFIVTNLVSVNTWAMAGTQIRRWLKDPARLRAFNWTMAVLLVASLWPILQGLL